MTRPIRAAVVGGGAFGECHMRTLAKMPEVELAGLYTLDGDRARSLCARHGGFPYPALTALLEDHSVDFVTIATPEDVHREIFLATAAAGKAIYVEKPLATSIAEAQAMLEVAPTVAMSGHCLRFESRLAQLFAEREQHGPLRHMSFRNVRTRAEKAVYGRVHPIWAMLCHEIDICNAFAGTSADKVLAHETRFVGEQVDGMNVLLQYPNGLTASIEGGWYLPAGAVAENDRCSFFFDTATVEITLPHNGFTVSTALGMRPVNQQYEHAIYGVEYGALRAALGYMVDCVRHNVAPKISTVADGLEAVITAEAALKSAGQGGWVERQDIFPAHQAATAASVYPKRRTKNGSLRPTNEAGCISR